MPRTRILALLLAICLPFGAFAQPPSPPASTAPPATTAKPTTPPTPIAQGSDPEAAIILTQTIEKHAVPGMAVALIKGGTVTRRAAAGLRAAGRPDALTLDDLWHLGSCTKAMTATLCAILVEKGTLRWDMTLAEAFPDLAPTMHAGYRSATLAQLCTNRAGVPSDLSAGGLWGRLWNATGTPTAQRRLLLEGVTARPPASTPGTTFEYANAGFAIAGHLCETVTGTPFEALMQEHLFAPLGMTTGNWGAPGKPANANANRIDQPRGHNAKGEPQEPNPASPSGVGADNPMAISPAGRLHCTIDDWAKFVTLHLQGHASNLKRNARLLKPATFDRLHSPPDNTNPYAFGWVRLDRAWAGPENNRTVLTHAGSNTMWFAVAWLAPARDMAVIITGNRAGPGEKACDEVASAMIALEAAK